MGGNDTLAPLDPQDELARHLTARAREDRGRRTDAIERLEDLELQGVDERHRFDDKRRGRRFVHVRRRPNSLERRLGGRGRHEAVVGEALEAPLDLVHCRAEALLAPADEAHIFARGREHLRDPVSDEPVADDRDGTELCGRRHVSPPCRVAVHGEISASRPLGQSAAMCVLMPLFC